MRRIGLLVLAAVAALAPAGCSGADAGRAEELLRQSGEALQSVQSYRFAGRFWIESEIGDFSLVMRGGGNKRGDGASFVSMRSDDIPGFPEVTVVQQSRTMWVRAGGPWKRLEVSAGQPSGLEQFDLAPYVKDVSVQEGAVVGGEPATKVTGTVDTTALLTGLFETLDGSSGLGPLPLDEVSDAFDDTHVVIYLSDVSHLPVRTLVDMSMEAEGEKVEMHLDFALELAKRRVRIPVPAA
jgi:hypothetical protein